MKVVTLLIYVVILGTMVGIFLGIFGSPTLVTGLQRGDRIHRKLLAPGNDFYGQCSKFTFIAAQAVDDDNKIVVLMEDCKHMHNKYVLSIWSASEIEEKYLVVGINLLDTP